MAELRSLLKQDENVKLYAISVDPPDVSKTLAEKIGSDGKGAITFPLLSDPDHKVIDAYGLRDPAYEGQKVFGIPHPAVYVIDKNGKVAWARIESDYRQRPTNQEIRAAIDRITPSISANNMFPQWSHDSKKIVFTSDRDGDPEIYVMNADGSNPSRLTQARGRDAHPFFSRDGGRIVFQSPRANGSDTNIYVMSADGSNLKQLTDLKGFAGVPSYSPDETRIVFQWRESNDFNDDKKWRICIMNSDGSSLRVITPGTSNDQVPNWSREGNRLLFYSDRTGKNQIYTMKIDGTNVQRISSTAFDDNAAFWSPDNTQITFTSDRDGNRELYVMGSTGENPRRLTHTPATERAGVWSPDGKKIAFHSDGAGPVRIYVMNSDGSGLVSLTH